jgi:hypothetical protein
VAAAYGTSSSVYGMSSAGWLLGAIRSMGSLRITCSKTSSMSCMRMGELGRLSNPTVAICMYILYNPAKVGSAIKGKGSTLGIVY